MGQDDRDIREHRNDPHEDPNDGDAGASGEAASPREPARPDATRELAAPAGAGAPADAGARPEEEKPSGDGEFAGAADEDEDEAQPAGRAGDDAREPDAEDDAPEADAEDDGDGSAERARIAERLAGARRLESPRESGDARDAEDDAADRAEEEAAAAQRRAEAETAPRLDLSAVRGAKEADGVPGVGRLLNGRYRLASVVGRGGMGTVWQAQDEVLGRRVAVKELRLPPGVDEGERKRMITRTLREAKAIAAIRSRGVVTVYDVVDEGARPWIVMELIEGRSLADIIRNDGPMSSRRAAGIGLAILDVLRDAHAAGILHRDVKPSNVIVAEEDGRVVLTDFGIAKVEGDPSITSTGMLVGAPSYISPERARGEAPGPPADLWSLGALLYCCVEGRPPYDEGSAIATLAAVMHDPVRPPRHAGPLTELVNGLLIKDPAGRLDERQARALLGRALAAEPERPAPQPGSDQATVVVGLGARRPRDPRVPAAPRRQAPAVAETPPPPRTPLPPSGDSGPGRGEDGARRRALLLGAAVVVLLALIATVLVVVLGDDGGSDGAGSSGGATQQQTADEGAGEQGGEEGAGGDPPADPQEGGEQNGEESGEGSSGSPEGEENEAAPPGTAPETDPGADMPGSPAGYAAVEDEDFHFRISLPQGWQRIGIAGQNSGGIYAAGDGQPPKVQVDFTADPTEDAEAAWHDLEAAVSGSSQDYRLLGIQSVQWRDYPTVADWQFERTEHGQRVRVLDRGFRIDDEHGYAIMITCLADEWDSEECRTLRETAFDTFQPLDSPN
ncbi:serine/threonine-protein kinase [Streptomyces hoynatensis]|uniref:non-specific serine/threonine protein kinase n=1 Tax=Streptomyces hoynatensis TaxID=1141874 RepID=A0A3A9ZEP2_9ACTN|nr:serine/threonine-protein kinase [Streptomyces hoynatensis]RKN46820.1 serine/threonine protein kinase [Streptomyces hoynatensis]